MDNERPHDDLIDDLDAVDDLDALAADLELDADQLALYRDQPIEGFLDETAARSKAVETEVQVLPIRRYPAPRLREVKYERAIDFVNGSPLEDLEDGDRYFAILSGKFIFGDMIEAYLFERDHVADEILIATLSMSQNNCDSLAGIIDAGRVKRLGLILSTYWYAVEMKRRVGYLVEHLSRAPEFHWAAISLHTKIVMLREGDRHYVMHGSANLRSCGQLEQVVIERNEALYHFNRAWMEKVLHEFEIRPKKKPIWGDDLWQTVQ